MKKFICLLLIFVSLEFYAGGPWLTPKKSGFFQIQSTFPVSSYNQLFLEKNKSLALNRNALDYTFQAYLEYGITDRLNVITTLPYKYVATKNTPNELTNSNLLPSGSLAGFSNYKLALKYRLSNRTLKAAVSLQSSFNSINKNLSKGLTTGYDANSVGLYAHIGKSFSQKLYSFADAGINIQTNNFSDYLELHYELGYQLKPSFWTVLTIDVRESLKGGTYRNENLRQTGLYTNDQEYFAYGFKFAYELKNKIGFTLATFGAFSGNYVAKVGTFSIGIYKKW